MSSLEDEIAAWARSMGYKPGDASLSRSNLSKLCRGPSSRAFWEYVTRNFHGVEQLSRLRAAQAEHQQQQGGAGMHEGDAESEWSTAQREAAHKRLCQRQALLPKVQANNATLKKMRDMHLKRYQDKLKDSMRLEAQSVGAQHSKEDFELQLHALRAFHQRWEALLPLLSQQASRISAARSWARARAQAAAAPMAGSDLAAHLPPLAHQARLQLEQQVQQVWGVCLPPSQQQQQRGGSQSGTGHVSSYGAPSHTSAPDSCTTATWASDLAALPGGAGLCEGEGGLCLTAGGRDGDEQQQAALGLLMRQQPQLVLATLAKMAQEAAQQLAAAQDGDPAAQLAAGAGGEGPLELLKRLQKAHLDRCIEAQEQHNTSAQAVERMSSLLADSTELQAALSSPLTKCRVQVAGQRARLSALSSELRRLQSQCAVHSPHHQSMQLSFEALGSARRLLGRLSQLIVQLSEEGAALVQGWGAQEETWSVALHSYLPNICVAAAHNAALARDCIAGEVAAWQRLPCHLLLPVELQQQQREQRQRRQTGRQQQQQQEGGLQQQQQWEQQKEQQQQREGRPQWEGHAGTGEDARDTARPGSHLNDQVPHSVEQGGRRNGQLCMGAAAAPLLVCQGRALPLLPQLQDASPSASGNQAGAGAGAGGAAAGEGMGGAPGWGAAAGAGVAGSGWGAGSGRLSVLSSRGGGTLLDSGFLALGRSGSGVLPHTPGVGGSVAGRLALLLHAASEMDSAAAVKCPYSLPTLVAGQQLQLRSLLAWLSESASIAQEPARKLQEHHLSYRSVRKAMDAMRREDMSVRLPLAQSTLERLQQLRTYYDGPFLQTVAECRELPAVSLLPDVKVEGCSAAEWLQAVRDSHALLRIAREEQQQQQQQQQV